MLTKERPFGTLQDASVREGHITTRYGMRLAGLPISSSGSPALQLLL